MDPPTQRAVLLLIRQTPTDPGTRFPRAFPEDVLGIDRMPGSLSPIRRTVRSPEGEIEQLGRRVEARAVNHGPAREDAPARRIDAQVLHGTAVGGHLADGKPGPMLIDLSFGPLSDRIHG